MNRFFRNGQVVWSLLLASTIVIFIVGCAGKTPVSQPAAQMEAILHNQRGIKAEARGESSLALESFTEALRVYRSIENRDGIIVVLVNTSRVLRTGRDYKNARIKVTEAASLVSPRSNLYSEVAFEMALTALSSGELDMAYEWAGKAVAADKDTKTGVRINLLARILFLKGEATQAELKAQEALSLNRGEAMQYEEANSLRLLGDILAAGKRKNEAAEFYNRALVIDKSLGKSRKISADLRALALLSQAQNYPDQALDYYQRAYETSSNGGDLDGAAHDLLEMSRIYEMKGERTQSERKREESDRILRALGTLKRGNP